MSFLIRLIICLLFFAKTCLSSILENEDLMIRILTRDINESDTLKEFVKTIISFSESSQYIQDFSEPFFHLSVFALMAARNKTTELEAKRLLYPEFAKVVFGNCIKYTLKVGSSTPILKKEQRSISHIVHIAANEVKFLKDVYAYKEAFILKLLEVINISDPFSEKTKRSFENLTPLIHSEHGQNVLYSMILKNMTKDPSKFIILKLSNENIVDSTLFDEFIMNLLNFNPDDIRVIDEIFQTIIEGPKSLSAMNNFIEKILSKPENIEFLLTGSFSVMRSTNRLRELDLYLPFLRLFEGKGRFDNIKMKFEESYRIIDLIDFLLNSDLSIGSATFDAMARYLKTTRSLPKDLDFYFAVFPEATKQIVSKLQGHLLDICQNYKQISSDFKLAYTIMTWTNIEPVKKYSEACELEPCSYDNIFDFYLDEIVPDESLPESSKANFKKRVFYFKHFLQCPHVIITRVTLDKIWKIWGTNSGDNELEWNLNSSLIVLHSTPTNIVAHILLILEFNQEYGFGTDELVNLFLLLYLKFVEHRTISVQQFQEIFTRFKNLMLMSSTLIQMCECKLQVEQNLVNLTDSRDIASIINEIRQK